MSPNDYNGLKWIYWLSATELGHLKQRVHVHAHTKNGKSERKHVSAYIFNFYSVNKREGIKKDAANKYLKPRGILFSWIY